MSLMTVTFNSAAACLLGALLTGTAGAQTLDVPFDTYCPPDAQAACFGVATVMGLDPNGDGFLAVRSGPGSNYRMLAKVHNGDRLGVYGKQGRWYAISHGADNRLGWVHGNWLGNFIP